MALVESSLESRIVAELKKLNCNDKGSGSGVNELAMAVAIAVIAEIKKADIVAPANGGNCSIQ